MTSIEESQNSGENGNGHRMMTTSSAKESSKRSSTRPGHSIKDSDTSRDSRFVLTSLRPTFSKSLDAGAPGARIRQDDEWCDEMGIEDTSEVKSGSEERVRARAYFERRSETISSAPQCVFVRVAHETC